MTTADLGYPTHSDAIGPSDVVHRSMDIQGPAPRLILRTGTGIGTGPPVLIMGLPDLQLTRVVYVGQLTRLLNETLKGITWAPA